MITAQIVRGTKQDATVGRIEEINMSGWINTDDRKPEHGQAVLGADRTGYVTRFEYDATDPPCFLDDHEEFFPEEDIIAWMPLPVYQKEGEEHD